MKKGYKGFNKGLVCRGFQYEEGKAYQHKGNANLCSSGFHYCENPLDVWDYYGPCESEFAEVEDCGNGCNDGKKSVTDNIKINAKLDLKGFISAAISFVWVECKDKNGNGTAASGDYSQLAASGDYSQLAASGYYSQLAASGYYSKLAASGYYSKLAASGDSSQLAASGDYSKLAVDGEYSVGAGIGVENMIKAKLGCWITLAEWKCDSEKYRYVPVCVKSAQIDGDALKPDTWYKLINGEFKEV